MIDAPNSHALFCTLEQGSPFQNIQNTQLGLFYDFPPAAAKSPPVTERCREPTPCFCTPSPVSALYLDAASIKNLQKRGFSIHVSVPTHTTSPCSVTLPVWGQDCLLWSPATLSVSSHHSQQGRVTHLQISKASCLGRVQHLGFGLCFFFPPSFLSFVNTNCAFLPGNCIMTRETVCFSL